MQTVSDVSSELSEMKLPIPPENISDHRLIQDNNDVYENELEVWAPSEFSVPHCSKQEVIVVLPELKDDYKPICEIFVFNDP